MRGYMFNLIMNTGTAAPPSIFEMVGPLILIFILFWFLLIRPQQKRMKEHQALLQSIQRGDKVMTNGGILGKVTKATDDELTIDVQPNGTKLQVRRTMIADVIRPQPANDSGKKK